MAVFFYQITSTGGETTMYLARDTFPSYAYFEAKARAVPGVPGAVFVPQPPTQDEEGFVFCNFAGDDNAASNSTLCLELGGNQNSYKPLFIFIEHTFILFMV